MKYSSLALGLSIALAATAQAQQQGIETIKVIGTTPLGASVDLDHVATNVQSATAEDIRREHALDMADFMRQSLSSVFVNDAQDNPLQPDVQYRGFVGSPLLGLPQGIAVYQGGVRVNEPFGDTVNWALIPKSAIDTVYLMPGSNPLFGLNALGGAISIKTKNGFADPGSSAEVSAGSFSRVHAEAETGGSINQRLAYFVTGAYLDEDGWRDFSPTKDKQFFGDLGWQLERTRVDASLTLAKTDLIGNGASPVDLLKADRKAIFTRPDQTRNKLAMLNVVTHHQVSDTLNLTGNVYFRDSDVKSYNGDDSDYEACDDNPAFLCGDEDEGGVESPVLDQNGRFVPASDDVEGATVNRTSTEQDGRGFSFQASWSGDLGRHENFFVAGLAYDGSDIAFDASTELGTLDDTRLAIPSGVFVADSFTRMDADLSTTGFYLSEMLSLSDRLTLTLSGRYNDARVRLRDQLGAALDGSHDFEHFNPAVGLTASISKSLTLYASYSESNRAPSPVELTCADPDAPCRLPNAFVSDPPLKQVVAATSELGARGKWGSGSWSADVFRTVNDDDILFISAGAFTNQGFFGNVGRTRRQGLELSLNGQTRKGASWFMNYTYLDATFRSDFAVPSPNNPAAIDGQIFVRSGDRLPLVPNQLLKAGARFPIGSKLSLGGNFLVSSEQFLRGDEGNDVEPVGGYTVLNARADYKLSGKLRLFLEVDNVLDREYETFGVFGEAEDVLGPNFDNTRFLSPAAPRAAWLGVSLKF